MTVFQPSDEWDFLNVDDDEPEVVRPPELGAVHVVTRVPRTPARDVGRADVQLGEEDRPEDHVAFADEEPVVGPSPATEPESEVDLEDMLESQHYAFGEPDIDDAEQGPGLAGS